MWQRVRKDERRVLFQLRKSTRCVEACLKKEHYCTKAKALWWYAIAVRFTTLSEDYGGGILPRYHKVEPNLYLAYFSQLVGRFSLAALASGSAQCEKL